MSSTIQTRYNRAYGIASYIVEGHKLEEVKEEFRISRQTIERDLDYLAHYGDGKDNERNLRLYKKAKMELYRHMHSRKN